MKSGSACFTCKGDMDRDARLKAMLDAAARLGVCAASNSSNVERVADLLRANSRLNRDKKSGAWGFVKGMRELLTDRGKLSAKKWFKELHGKERAQLVLDKTDGEAHDFCPSQKCLFKS
jgi:hypothetical protein